MIEKRNKLGQFIKTGKIVKCYSCKKTIYIQLYQLEYKKHFCSRKCYLEWQREHLPKEFKWWENNKLKRKIIKKMSKVSKGKHRSPATEYIKGEHPSINTEIKLGQHLSKKTQFKKGHKWSIETEQRRIKNSIIGLNKTTKPELLLKSLLPNNYIHNNQAQLLIEHFVPDFINIKNKKIIEMFGDYWHNRPKQKKKDYFRFKVYNRNGYQTLVIWEHELKNIDKLKIKIRRFLHDS